VKARSRLSPGYPRRESPREDPVRDGLKPRAGTRDSRQGKKTQEPRLAGPARCYGIGKNGGENGRWGNKGQRCPGNLARGETSEGRIPRALPV
jgi:hypothetical protein